jgi:hypothetical protein
VDHVGELGSIAHHEDVDPSDRDPLVAPRGSTSRYDETEFAMPVAAMIDDERRGGGW